MHGNRLGRHINIAFFLKLRIASCMIRKVKVIDRKSKRFQRMLPHSLGKLALPYRNTVPSHSCQSPLNFLVTLSVAFNLVLPEVGMGLRQAKRTTVVAMPKAPVHKDACAIPPQHDIGVTWQPSMINPIAKSMLPKVMAHHNFRACAI